jgi:hypothetical protein
MALGGVMFAGSELLPAEASAQPGWRTRWMTGSSRSVLRWYLGEPGRGGGDLLPCLVPLRPMQLLCRDGDRLAVHLDAYLVGVRGDVVIPGRIPRRPGR